MKKVICLLLSVIMFLSISACSKPEADATNTLSPAVLTPREEMLAAGQDVFLFNYETDGTYKTVTLSIELYNNGVASGDVTNFKCALPQNAEKKGNNHGSLAVVLGPDYRFSASVCDQDGSVISSMASDVVQPVKDATMRNIKSLVAELTPIDGKVQTLAYLAYGDETKTQGVYPDSVFLNPVGNAEQAAAFDQIYLIKCRFV